MRALFEDEEAVGLLPDALATLYGGGLALAADAVYANFISSMDGVTALAANRGPGSVLRGDSEADRFVMALLRDYADAILIGAGTLRTDRGHVWTAEYIDRDRAEVHRAVGRPAPRLVVATASGELDPSERALQAGALVLTTDAGARQLSGRLPQTCTVRSLGERPPSGPALLAAIREEGHRRVLTEGGPTLLGRLAADRVLDELFLTLSPVLAGRRAGDGRLGLIEGLHLLPKDGRWGRLRSVRAAGSHLFLRYAFRRSGQE